MRKLAKVAIGVGVVAGLGFLISAHHRQPQPTPVVSSQCHIRGNLPDPTCTPGAINPEVTQATIGNTICQRGWTATVRPPASVTGPEKVQSIKDYGYSDTSTGNYEYDHLIPLELGGATNDPKNLWAEPAPAFHTKDLTENNLKAEVCAGKLTLSQAQQEISTNWETAR